MRLPCSVPVSAINSSAVSSNGAVSTITIGLVRGSLGRRLQAPQYVQRPASYWPPLSRLALKMAFSQGASVLIGDAQIVLLHATGVLVVSPHF